MNTAITGSIVALVTPMYEDGAIDWEALDNLVDWHIRMGTNGIVAVGTTGESATVDFEEHRAIVARVVERAAGRLPVIATLEDLNEQALLDILVKPKNALIRQYTKIFEFENPDIERLQDEICRRMGFHPRAHTHRIEGCCRQCFAPEMARSAGRAPKSAAGRSRVSR